MYLTGFADEASSTMDGQIAATKELGWKWIESRNAGSGNIHDISEADFDIVVGKLEAAGVGINCFGSGIANWSKDIRKPFDSCLEQARRAISRMNRLGTKLIRIMSYPMIEDKGTDDQMEEERFRRLRELVKMFGDHGITVLHENCHNYGGMGYPFTLRLLEQVPGLKLVFDSGNPVFTDDYTKPKPRPKQSSWEFYSKVREHVVYMHVKDGRVDPAKENGHTFPGEGQGDVRRIVADLLSHGYDGGFSMEPHLAVVAHDPSITSPEAIRYANYVEYGRRFMTLLDEVKAELKGKGPAKPAGATTTRTRGAAH